MQVYKITHEVIIFTDQFKIEGEVHLIEGERITDFMRTGNSSFLPVTNATISSIYSSMVLVKAEFVSLNRDKVILLVPRQVDDGEQPETEPQKLHRW